MTVLEAIQRGAAFLERKGVDSPRLQSELLLAHALGVARLQLYLQFERELTEAERIESRRLIQLRGERIPLQHLVGTTSFCGLELEVNPSVLIPRPETELLAERAWILLHQQSDAPSLRVLDFGTGSGCLAIALAVRCPNTTVLALDISNDALQVAERNATRHQVQDRIHFVRGDGFAALDRSERFDLIISNPPYIPTGVIPTLAPEVRDHDPRKALDGGPDGLTFYRLFANEAAGWLVPGP